MPSETHASPLIVTVAAALALSIAAPAWGANFHPIVSISSSTTATDLYPVGNLIQGAGAGFDASEPHPGIGSGATHTWVTNAPNGSGDYWDDGTPDPVLVIDLGADVLLVEITTWGYSTGNTNGAKDFSLRFATDAEGTGGFGTSITYNPGFQAAFDTSPRDSHFFSQAVTARYVEMTITDNWRGLQGGLAGGDRVGLGELAFEDTTPPPDPVIDIATSLVLALDGSVQAIDLPVGNLGATQMLTLGTPTFTGAHAAAFSVIDSPATVGPGTNDLIQLSFNPTGITGAVNAELAVTSNDLNAPTSNVALSGFIHDPQLAVGASFNLGTFPSGSGPQSSLLNIENAGASQVLSITSTNITGSNAANFSVLSAPASLPPLSQGTIDIRIDPMGADGQFTAQLEITTNDAVTPLKIVNLSALVGDAIPNSGVRINEFMANNGSTLDDGDGNSSDWIELYNAGPGPVDLAGWYLTDDDGDLNKWEFPLGTVLAENAYLIVFASGQNTNDYIDAGGYLHTNFKLTTGGEYLALVKPNATTVVSAFTPTYPSQFNDVSYGTYSAGGGSADLIAGSDADVLVPSDGSLGLTWTFPSFTPGVGWIVGGTGTGVGFDTGSDYDPFIDIDVQSGMLGSRSCAYIRIPFTVADASAVSSLQLTIRYDDGFYAYLNGTEIANRNAPANPDWNSTTGNVNESNNLETIDVTSYLGSLENGANVLAIHGINRSTGSSDFLADPELVATSPGTGPILLGYMLPATPGVANTGGAANPGPEISMESHAPQQPAEDDDIVVTALVTPRQDPIGPVTLHYRVVYGSETTVAMVDDGTGADTFPGDGIHTAIIPSSVYGAEDMVRWYITAQDSSANSSRSPPFLDSTGKNQSPEYFGTVTQNPAAASDLPLLQWFTTSESASHTRTGVRASAYFLGRFYDNIFVRRRGGATNGSVSQKFDFNKGDSLYINPEMPSVGEVNMNGNGADSTYVRQTLAFDGHRAAGNEGCLSELWQMRINGGFDRVGVFIEQVDEDFLERNGYDRDGELYKFVQRSNLNPVFADTITGIEKKTNDQTDFTTVEALVADLNLPTSAERRAWVIDNLDLPQIVNYLAARSITQDADDLRKNFYMFQDLHGDGRWRQFPWDKDYTFGVVGDGGTHLPHPFFGDEEHKKQNANQWNILYDVIFEEPVTQRIYLRRLRTLMDDVLQPSSTPLIDRYFENRAQQIIDPASPPLGSNIAAIDSYLASRRSVLFNNYPTLIPASQPASPAVTITAIDYNPVSTNQDEEFIRLTTTESTEIDISGWELEGGVRFTFRPGTVIERNGDLYVSPDTLAFRNRAVSPKGGEEHLSVGPYSGHLSNFSETLILKDAAGTVVDTFVTPNDPSDQQLHLVISEIMYHPADPDGDAEFIELMNMSNTLTLDLNGVHFSAGINFTFGPGTSLAPGERILVVLDQSAFEAVHGTGLNIAGEFQNGSRLNNGSDRIVLDDATNSTILDFNYNDDPPWPTGPDGGGFSLVLVAPENHPDPDASTSWRESSTVGGNPDASDTSVFAGDPAGDLDHDGIMALLEHALGTSDTIPNTQTFLATRVDDRMLVTVQVAHGADDVLLTLEHSDDLSTWIDAEPLLPLTSSTNNGDGTSTLIFESADGFYSGTTRAFVRLKVALLP